MERKEKLPPTVVASITVISGKDKGVRQELKFVKNIIGRTGTDLGLNDTKISSQHATIEYIDGNFYIFDLESTNGTFLNGKEIKESVIKNQDEIQIGLSTLIFSYDIKELSDFRGKSFLAHKKSDDTTKITMDKRTQISKAVEEELQILNSKNGENGISPFDVPKYQITLKVIDGSDRGKNFKLTKNVITIGRQDADIKLTDIDVSRRHAQIEIYGPNQILIKDLDSTNGTFIKGKKIRNTKISHLDEFQVGKSIIQLIVS